MSAKIYVEGGGERPELRGRCRKSFRELLERAGLATGQLKVVACGPRHEAFSSFQGAFEEGAEVFVGMIVDSEEPVAEVEKPWSHLRKSDPSWKRPKKALDEQVFLMTTCMETWIVCDLKTLQKHYGSRFQASALPSKTDLERRERGEVQKALARATRNCSNAYAKGQRSFEVLGKLDPDSLAQHLPSFARMRRILNAKLGS